MSILQQHIPGRGQGLLTALNKLRSAIPLGSFSAYVPGDASLGYSPTGEEFFDVRNERRYSDQGVGYGAVVQVDPSELESIIAGQKLIKSYTRFDSPGIRYRMEIEPNKLAWGETYRTDDSEQPISNEWSYSLVVSLHPEDVRGTFVVPNTLQKYGVLRIFTQAHDWDRNLAGVYGALGVTPPWSLAYTNDAVVIYLKLLAGLGIVSDPLVILERDVHEAHAAGMRLAVVWRIKWTKQSDGFVEVYTAWIDSKQVTEPNYTLKYGWSGATIHPENINYCGYVRGGGVYFSDAQFYKQQIIDDGSGYFGNGYQEHAVYYDRPAWADHRYNPAWMGNSLQQILDKHKLIKAA